MEPEWSKQIPNVSVCNFFYALAVVYAIFVILGLVSYAYGVSMMKGLSIPMKLLISLMYSFGALVVLTFYFFMYLLCDRSLLSSRTVSVSPKEGFFARKA